MFATSLRSLRAAPLRATARAPLARSFAGQTDTGPNDELVRDFLPPGQFFDYLGAKGVKAFMGVPDSLLKDFAGYVNDNAPKGTHVITANEGAAVGMAAGYHMATGKVPLVYLQNSGLGNTINPLLSLADPKVYGIPMIVMVGWRGEPGKRDEPQHIVQGAVTPGMLAAMDIQFAVLPDYLEGEGGAMQTIDHAVGFATRRKAPFCLLVKRQTFEPYKQTPPAVQPQLELNREEFLRLTMEAIGDWDIVVSSTGFTSREVFELREELGQDHSRDFLTVGSMGHSSAIALGIAQAKPSRSVFCLDGDGSLAMHMGTMVTVGAAQPKNFKHIVLNNGVHDSVGGQTTDMLDMDVCKIAQGCQYKHTFTAHTEADLKVAIQELIKCEGPALLEARIRPGARKNLGRPTTTTQENKIAFMEFVDS